ncbi:MAG: Gfo/Idh/MocA family oxidoreductase [Candidatus Omnitrophica bacterium]|nr:Gfo/Idh/MocA family oxidoreductase [Candidatus Omnitrophota bacterium]
MKKIKTGIIGVGGGKGFIDVLRESGKADVIAVCDIYKQRAEETAEEKQIPHWFEDYRRMLELKELDLVIVRTDDKNHAPISLASLSAGKDVLVEKPMAIAMEELEAMVKKVEETKKILMVNYILRYNPICQLVKRHADKVMFGKIFYIQREYLHNLDKEGILTGTWRAQKDGNHTPITGGGCHAIDAFRWILEDEAEEVFAYGNKMSYSQKEFPSPDSIVALIKFKKGTIGKIHASFGCILKYYDDLQVMGTEGSFVGNKFYYSTKEEEAVSTNLNYPGHPYQPLVKDLLDSIIERKSPPIDVYDGANASSVALAIMESLSAGKPVRPRVFVPRRGK